MYNANYMEGVPVKIAEKYKPPPQIYKLPQSLVNKLNLAENFYENSTLFQYDMQLERKASSKIVEWKRIRQRNKDIRRERKERRELQRKQEEESRQKNLLGSVSYPSADDLSSSGSEGEVDQTTGETSKSKEADAVVESCPQICVTDPTNSFHNILQPTVLSNNSKSTAAGNNITHSINSLAAKSTQLMTFNYKDFEDDTSSPFDNIELKTINDLDVLAQVLLHNTQLNSTPGEVETRDDDEGSNSATVENANETHGNANDDEKVISERQYIQPETFENIPKRKNLPKFSYDLGNLNSAQEAQSKLSDYSAAVRLTYANQSPALSPQAYTGLEQHHHQQNLQYQGYVIGNNDYYNNVNMHQTNAYGVGENVNASSSEMTHDVAKWKKSVPDILKELRDEIRNSELRRSRNCSHNLGNDAQKTDACQAEEEARSKESVLVEDVFCDLDSEARQLAEQISSMGFPKPRVARIVELLGADDKKIIEHLIPLSELADLGFDETEISKALMRHENNKNKALDDLIS